VDGFSSTTEFALPAKMTAPQQRSECQEVERRWCAKRAQIKCTLRGGGQASMWHPGSDGENQLKTCLPVPMQAQQIEQETESSGHRSRVWSRVEREKKSSGRKNRVGEQRD
jgi:hypothetical protein